jgi:hypothetical protein
MIRRTLCVIALITAVALVGSSLAAGAAQQFRLRDESTQNYTLRFSGAGDRTMTVRNINGVIRVSGSTDPAVQVQVRRTIFADTDADLRRGEQETVIATADQRADVSAIVRERSGSSCGEPGERGSRDRERPVYQARLDFSVRVPANTRLVLCTVNGELVDVQNTSGDFQISNVNGRIDLENVRGSGSATTVNGPITATLLDVPRSDGEFKTVNGGITITWPAQLAADFRMKTFNGGLYTDFDAVPMPSPSSPMTRQGGRLVMRGNEFAHVRVGGGGPQLTLETLNGDVRVLRASR